VDRRTFLLAAAAVLAAPTAAVARVSGGMPAALVTADLESRVVVVELSSGRVVGSIPTLPGPRSIESCPNGTAVVAHTAHGAVTLIDGPTLRVRSVLRGFGEPRYTAAGLAGELAYISDSRRGEVVVLDTTRGRVLGRVAVGGPARHIAVTDSKVWTALGTRAERIAVVDVSLPERPRLVRTFRTPWLAHDVGFTPGGRRVWVTSADSRALAVYGALSGRLLRTLHADAPPQHVTFLGGRAYVTSGDDGRLRVHALDGRLLGTTSVPVGSHNVQEGWGVVLTPSLERGTLCVVSPRGRLLHRVQAARSSHDACFVMSR
jgi:DNA-binding beta-propeller fold protein YncE